jgi:hypothetical protein
MVLVVRESHVSKNMNCEQNSLENSFIQFWHTEKVLQNLYSKLSAYRQIAQWKNKWN